MKVFLKFFAIPLLIGVIATVLYIVDALLAGLFVSGASFMWVAFANWTIFYGAELHERVRGFIGVIIGFVVGVIMMLITGSFTLNIATISISCLIGVLVMNFAVMFLNHTSKFWTNSVTGVFAGIFLTFSGLGQGLSPVASTSEAFLMLGIIAIWTIFGLICGFFSTYCTKKITAKLETLEPSKKAEEKTESK